MKGWSEHYVSAPLSAHHPWQWRAKGSLINIYGLGAAAGEGATKIGRPTKGGHKILDVSRKGGRKILNFPRRTRRGAKHLDLINFFFDVPKMKCFHVLGVFWALFFTLFLGWRGGKNSDASRGGRKILDASSMGTKEFRVIYGNFRQLLPPIDKPINNEASLIMTL